MKKLSVFLCLLLFTSFLPGLIVIPVGSVVGGSNVFGGASNDFGYSVIETSDGGLVLAGWTSSFGAGDDDAWLVKTDDDGNMLWNKTYGGAYEDAAHSVIQTSDEGLAFAGECGSFTTPGYTDFWLVRTDAFGNELWNQTYGGGGYQDTAECVVETSDGGFAMAGYSSHGNTDMFLVKTDSAGNELWTQYYGGDSYDFALSLVETSDGGFALVGYTASFGAGETDVWLVRVNSSGLPLWNQTFGGSGYDEGYDIAQTIDGGFALTGSNGDSGNDDFYLIRTDSDGVLLWSKVYGGVGGQTAKSIVQTTSGGFALAGETWTSVNGWDVWLVVTDNLGNELWNQTYGGLSGDFAESIVKLTDDGFVMGGYSNSFGVGGYDYYLVRVDDSSEHHTFSVYTAGQGSVQLVPDQATYVNGSYVEVTAIADPGWVFDHWVLDGVDFGNLNPINVSVVDDHNFTAVFIEGYNYSLTIFVNGDGYTDPSEGIHQYLEGTQVNVTAYNIPEPEFHFSHWILDDVNVGSDNPITITMDNNHSLTAWYDLILPVQYDLTIDVIGNGSTNPVVGVHQYWEDTYVPVTAIPDSGWRFDHWEIDSVDGGSVNPYSVLMHTNRNLVAVFVEGSVSAPHDPIFIWGNGNFTAENGVVSGDGSEGNPWIIENWDISSNSSNGIYIGGDTTDFFVVRNCTINGDGGNRGILLQYVVNGKIEDNTLNNNDIKILHSSNNTIVGNKISDTDHSIDLTYSNNNTITKNIVNNGTGVGVLLGAAYNNTLIGNTILNCTGDPGVGIDMINSFFNTFTDNTVSYCEGEGIFLEPSSSNNLFTNNTVSHSHTGFYLWGAYNNNLIGNTITYNDYWGVLVSSSINTTITSCQIHDNTLYGVLNGDGGSEYVVNATYNWWGSVDGPSGFGPGTGDAVSSNVLYDPWDTKDISIYALTIYVVGNGYVFRNPDQASYANGTIVELTATADPGWTFANYTGDLTGFSSVDTINMTGNMTVTVTFTEDQYTLGVNTIGNGDVEVDPLQGFYTYDNYVYLTATADPGWLFDHWVLDSIDVGSVNPYTLHMNDNHIMVAVFEPAGIPHDPIFIWGNADFTAENGVVSGDGSEGNPWIIENWDISSNSSNGIFIGETTDFFVVRNCTVNGNGVYSGIFLNNLVNGEIEDNTLSGNQISVYSSSNNNIIGNTLSDSGTSIILSSSDNNTITKNIVNNGATSVVIGGSFNNFTNNTITNSIGNALVLGGSNNTLIGNTILNCTGDPGVGINIDSSPSFNTLANNTVSYCDGDGIYLNDGVNNLFTSNTVSHCLQTGFYIVESINTTITNCIITNNPIFGVYGGGGSEYVVNATYNWWGSVDGPSGFGPGSGDAVMGSVLYDPWLTVEPGTYTLIIHVVGNGDVIKNPNQASYSSGSVVELIASPNAGWEFAGWSNDLTGMTNPENLTMDSDKTVTATFTEISVTMFNLTISMSGNGSVNPAVDVHSYVEGTVVNVTATPDSGWLFDHWELDSVNVGSTNPINVTMDANHTLVALFYENPASEWASPVLLTYYVDSNCKRPCISGDGRIVTFYDDLDYLYRGYVSPPLFYDMLYPIGEKKYPSINNDGSRIVYQYLSDSEDSEIALYDVAIDSSYLLTNNSVYDGVPKISADGSKVVFESYGVGQNEIFVVNYDGSGLVPVTNGTGGSCPSISADGSKIAFRSSDGVFVVNSDGTGSLQLTDYVVEDSCPSISGDGSKIAFHKDNEIFVVNVDGTGMLQLTNNTSRDRDPVINFDGSLIAFTSDVAEDFEYSIWVVNSDGSGLTRLTDGPNDIRPSINSKGTKIVYSSGSPSLPGYEGTQEIFLITSLSYVEFYLNLTKSGSGNLTSTGSGFYENGTEVLVTAVADVGWVFDHWELDSVDVGSANPYTVLVDGNHSLVAVFVEDIIGDEEWNVSLVASVGLFNDLSIFGTNVSATDGFDSEFDEIDPITPPTGVVSYFYYPDNPTFPVDFRKLSTSIVASTSAMNWTYNVASISVNGTLVVEWNASEVASIPEEFGLYLFVDADQIVDMRSVENISVPIAADESFSFIVSVAKIVESSFDVVVDGDVVGVSVASNSTITGFGFNETSQEFSFVVDGLDGFVGACNMTVPKSVGSAFVVYVDGEAIEFVQSENATHYFLWFSYTHSTHSVTVAVGVDFVVELSVGWNMVSFPAIPEDANFSSVFGGLGYYQVLTWDGYSYVVPSAVEVGVGYWVLVLEDVNVTISNAIPVTGFEVELAAGWSMLGSVYDEVVDAGDVFPGYYQLLTWDGYSYVPSTTIEPGKGYWALVLTPTTITVG